MHRELYAEAALSARNWTDEVDLEILMGGGWQQRIFSRKKVVY